MECDLGWGFELDDLALAHPRWPLLDVRGAESGWRLRDLSCAFEGGGLGQPVGVGGQVRDGIEHSGTGCVDGNSKVDSHWSCEVWCGLWLVGIGLGGSFTTTFERGDRGGTWKGARFICRVLLASWKRAGINSKLPIVVWKAA